MSVRIRLARIGKKKAPFYRIVAIDGRAKRDGQFLENLGTYNPISGELIQFHADRIKIWIEKGAIPSDTVVKLQHRFKKGNTGPLVGTVPIKNQISLKADLKVQVAAAKEPETVEATEGSSAAAKE